MFSKNNSLISKQDLYDFVKENVNTGTESKILQCVVGASGYLEQHHKSKCESSYCCKDF